MFGSCSATTKRLWLVMTEIHYLPFDQSRVQLGTFKNPQDQFNLNECVFALVFMCFFIFWKHNQLGQVKQKIVIFNNLFVESQFVCV